MKISLRFLMVALMESVHVELPDKRGIVAMFEVSGQHLVGEASNTVNEEGLALWAPTDDFLQFRVLSAATRTSTIYSSFDTKSGAWLRPRLLRLRFIILYTVESCRHYSGKRYNASSQIGLGSALTQALLDSLRP